MNRFLLIAVAAASSALVAPAAYASANIACPGFSGLGYCTFNEANQTGNFGDSFASAQAFSDTFTLTLAAAYDLSVTVTNTAATGGPITFSSAMLVDSSMNSLGNIAFGAVPTTFSLAAGTYALKFSGSALASSSYQGTIDVATVPVPAPATWGLMFVGIGALGSVMRRRLVVARTTAG